MATVTQPPIIDSTGQDIVDKLEEISEEIQSSITTAAVGRLGLVKPDGDTIEVTADGTISATKIYIPTPIISTQTYTYNGSEQTLVFTSISTSDVVITGNKATNAGSYSCTVTLKNPSAMWSDGTSAPKVYPWSIAKATGSITFSESSIELTTGTPSATVVVTIVSDGNATIAAADPTVVSVSPSIMSASGNLTITGLKTGATTVTATLPATTNFTGATTSLTVDAQMLPMKTFAAATDAEIAQMVAAADAGQIDLYEDCGWRVGQEHQTTISAIAVSGTYDGVTWSVGESQPQQTITLVLMHRGLYQLTTPVLDKQGNPRSTCSFVVGVKDCLSAAGYMNLTNTNGGSWNASNRRPWCNGGFRQSLSDSLRSVFKQFETVTAQTYSGSTNQTSQDYFALPAAAEVFKGDSMYGTGGSAGPKTAYSNLTEFNALTRFTWYGTTSNRVKTRKDSAYPWRERSPYYGSSNHFCFVSNNGGTDLTTANGTVGLSPFGCL